MGKTIPNVSSVAVESVSGTSQKTVKASDKNAFSKLVNKSRSKTQAKVNQKNAGQNNDGKDDGKKFPTIPSEMPMTRKLRSKISSLMKSKRTKIKLRLFRLRFSRFRSRKSRQFLKLT